MMFRKLYTYTIFEECYSNCYIRKGHYVNNNNIVLDLYNDELGIITRFTVNANKLSNGYIQVKNYSEGDGNAKWLVDNDIAEPTTPFFEMEDMPIMKLLVDLDEISNI